MMVSYNAAIVHVANRHIGDDTNPATMDVADSVIEMLSFVYGVRPARILDDIKKAYNILLGEEL